MCDVSEPLELLAQGGRRNAAPLETDNTFITIDANGGIATIIAKTPRSARV